MKILFTLAGIISGFISFSQLSISGTGSSTSVANNAPAITVDNNITITGSGTIDGAKVSVATNFSSGDVLGYSGSLPSGVTASYNASTGVLTFTGNALPADYQALLRTVQFNTTSSSALQRTVTFNLGTAINFSGNGHFYEYVSGSFYWKNAKAAAAAKTFYGLQGYLATITSLAENNFILQKLGADAWIGASDDYEQINAATGTSTYANQAASEGHWYWVTGPAGEIGTNFSNGNGSPVAAGGKFMNWNTSEPNNSSGTEHYGEIFSSGASGKWNDLRNIVTLGYVVEYGGMSGDPAVNITFSRNILMIATSIQTTSSPINYLLHDNYFAIDNNLTVYSTGNITDARVTISSNFQTGDVLSLPGAAPGWMTGASFNSSTGVLSLSGTATAAEWQGVFRRIEFYSTSNIKINRTITFSLGNQLAGSNGHFYEYVSTAGSWTTTKTNAAAKTYLGLHGYLATITSQEENDFIKQKLGADAWIGASDEYTQINSATGASTYANQAASEGHWYWVTGPAGEIGTNFSNGNGSPVAAGGKFMNWNTGEPNNSGGEHYGEIYASGSNPGKWNDLPNSSSLGYIVEYGGLASDPLLYLAASRTISISQILPITGLQFTASKENGGVLLKWSTNTETNTDRFEVEYSSDGINFNRVAQIQASGNSNTPKFYEWVHVNPAIGTNYYRIREIDFDERFTLSPVRQVIISSAKATIAPNPVISEFVLSYPYMGKPVSLSIVNTAGSVLLKTTITQNQTPVSVRRLPAGLYMAFIDDNKEIIKLKFVKQ